MILLFIIFFLASPVYAVYAGDGFRIMKESWDSFRAIPEEEEIIEMYTIPSPYKEWYTLKEAEGLRVSRNWKVTYKKLSRKLRYSPQGEDRIQIVFLEPASIREKSFLIWRHWMRNEADYAVAWLPFLKNTRRISSLDQRDMFEGTALTIEDIRRLMGERLEDFTITLAGEEVVDGRECYKIVLEPKKGVDTAYRRREFWRAKKGLPAFLQVKYYDDAGIVKIQKNSHIEEFGPGAWRVNLLEMRNLKKNFTSLLFFSGREIKKFNDSLFLEPIRGR